MPLLVKAVVIFNVCVLVFISEHYLIRCAHLKHSARLLVVAVVDSFYDSLNFGSLDKIKKLKLNGNLKRVSTGEVLVQHNCCQKIFVVHRINILNGHDHYLSHEYLADCVETEEFPRDIDQQLIKQAHGEQRVAAVTEHVALDGTVIEGEF